MKTLKLFLVLLICAFPCPAQVKVSGTGSLSGTGTITIVPFPIATPAPTTLAFGNVTQNTSSASQAITLTNSSLTALTIVSITTSSQYSRTTTCGAILNGSSSCTINVTFSPTGTGSIPGTLTITDNAPNTPQVVTLSGTGISASPPVAGLNPTSLNFGSVVQNSTSASQAVTLTNTGGTTLTITSIVASANYAQSNNCPGSLNAAAFCIINVTFTPTSLGSIPGTLTFTDNASGSPQAVALAGTGIASGSTLASPLNTSIGWSQFPGTLTNMSTGGFSVCPSGRQGDGTGQCGIIMQAWSGGIQDQSRNRLIFWGGGHTDYSFNEVYGLEYRATDGSGNWTPKIVRYTAGSGNSGTCSEAAADGISPTSRHTYGGLAYLSDFDQMWVFGGALATSGCPSPHGNWVFNLAQASTSCAPNCAHSAVWTRKDTGASGSFGSGTTDINDTGYDFVSKLAHFNDTSGGNNWVSWNPATNVYTPDRVGHSDGVPSGSTGTVDPYNRFEVIAGGGVILYYDLRNPANAPIDHSTMTNCGPARSATYPGITFNSVRKTVWVYPGSGNSLYEIDTAANTCTVRTFGSTVGVDFPTAGTSNGVFGRFQYAEADDVFIYLPDENHNAWYLRVNAPLAADTNSFATRAASTGVTYSNDLSNVTPQSSGNGYYLGSDTNHPWQQSSITPTGSGFSAMATVVGKTSAGASGFARHLSAAAACGQRGVHENCDIYWQYRYRRDQGANGNLGDTSLSTTMKVHIMHNDGVSCASIGDAEDTLQGWQGTGNTFPITYTGCGSDGNGTFPAVPNQTWVGFSPPYYLQQGDTASTGYNCSHEAGNFLTSPNCFNWLPNIWYTIQGHIHIGTLPSGTGKCVGCWSELWVAPQGSPLKQLMNTWSFNMHGDMNPYDTIDLLPYATGKDPAIDHAPARVWYKDLIIGTQPILPPTGTTPAPGQHP